MPTAAAQKTDDSGALATSVLHRSQGSAPKEIKMRPTHLVVALATVVLAIQALQTQPQETDTSELNEQQHLAAFSSPPPSSLAPSSPSVQEPPEFPTSPAETIKSPLEVVKDAIQQIMIHLPSKTPEPLFETTTTYCQAFHTLCTLICRERRQQKPAAVEDALKDAEVADNCANPQGTSIALAGAACRCMGLDFTEGINVAIAGGAIGPRAQTESSSTAKDPQNPISSVPMDLVRVMQSACHAIGLQDPSKPVPAEAGSVVGGLLSSVAGLIPGFGVVSALLPSIPLISKLIGSAGGDHGTSESAGLGPDLSANTTASMQDQAPLAESESKVAASISVEGSGEGGGGGPGGIVGWFSHVLGIDDH